MSSEKTDIPKGAVYTMRIPLDRDKTNHATYHIKDIDEAVYLAARKLFDADKDHDAVKMMLKALLVQPSDDVALIDNFVSLRSLVRMFMQLITPVEGELKKN